MVAASGAVHFRSILLSRNAHPDSVTREAQHRVSTLRPDMFEESWQSDRVDCYIHYKKSGFTRPSRAEWVEMNREVPLTTASES
ncbi:hypothetical protein CCR75_004060 [Bremia lactucae]|uniref:Uncharacterized protein n=1 Tax=Bremia lactucae TaxID=4779 RepID=A0A976IBG3_BRELC|nr:hypothetical protein CCR75_004060 [Bremia lactucae]